jgi:uncharacterized protein (TIGR03067 family)
MRTRMLLFASLLVMGFAPAPLPRRDRPQGDLEKMQGTWVVVSWRYMGKELSNGPRKGEVTFKRNHLTINEMVEGNPPMQFVYSIAKGKWPRTIDCLYALDGTSRLKLTGIYRFDGDTLTICYTQNSKRPIRFEGNGTSWLMVLKRPKK